MKKMLTPFKNELQIKVGAHLCEIIVIEPGRKYGHTSHFKVKQEEFAIYLEKI